MQIAVHRPENQELRKRLEIRAAQIYAQVVFRRIRDCAGTGEEKLALADAILGAVQQEVRAGNDFPVKDFIQ